MIICSCNVLTDSDVQAVLETAKEARDAPGRVYAHLGCTPQCGRCARSIRQIIAEDTRGMRSGTCR